MTTAELHRTLKSRLQERTTDQLIMDAKVARSQKTKESARMGFAFALDILFDRMPEAEFEALYEEITND